ncbi:MAG: hypothetical protein KC442_16670 [Thermomicrobiales bacterium]|nr:hypothetical protein [Thermomicrobiales bacterium]
MSLTFDLSAQPRFRRAARGLVIESVLALPVLAAAIFISLAPVDNPRHAVWPGQSCQERLAAAEAALEARERGDEVRTDAP